MPEGHSVHRIARQFARSFTGVPVAVSSPQGRFAAGAARLDGHAIVPDRPGNGIEWNEAMVAKYQY